MRRLADQFGDAAAACSSMMQLRTLLSDAASELGFHYFALLHHSTLLRPAAAHIRIDNYPEEWVKELIDGALVEHDPVHLASRRASMSFTWSQLGTLVRCGPRQTRILERSRHHGLGDGITVPINVPGEPAGSCSFAVTPRTDLSRRGIDYAAVVGTIAFNSARRIAGLPSPLARPHLSRREAQCMRLLAAGKTDWEIAAILGISPVTAKQYVKRLRIAYDVASRTQLVLLGLRDNWIDFDDAVGPA